MFNLTFQNNQKFKAGDKLLCPSCEMKAKIKQTLKIMKIKLPYWNQVKDKVLYQNLQPLLRFHWLCKQINDNGTMHLSMGAVTKVI